MFISPSHTLKSLTMWTTSTMCYSGNLFPTFKKQKEIKKNRAHTWHAMTTCKTNTNFIFNFQCNTRAYKTCANSPWIWKPTSYSLHSLMSHFWKNWREILYCLSIEGHNTPSLHHATTPTLRATECELLYRMGSPIPFAHATLTCLHKHNDNYAV